MAGVSTVSSVGCDNCCVQCRNVAAGEVLGVLITISRWVSACCCTSVSGLVPRPAPSTHHHQHCANGDGQVCHGGSVLCPTWVTDGWNCPNQHNLVSRLSSATEEKWKYVNSSSVNWQHDIGVKIFGGVKIFLHWSVSNCNNLRRCGNTVRRAAYL